MMLSSLLLIVLLAFNVTIAAPLHASTRSTPSVRSLDSLTNYLCKLKLLQPYCAAVIKKPLVISPNGVSTPFGNATGTLSSPGVARFAVRYASAGRWQSPTVATTWQLPSNNPSALPPWCPQPNADDSEYSEDCLFIILHVPIAEVLSGATLNTLLWIHGGSFYVGAATYPGLDGSNLALATKSIVATVQYRLGVLGFLPPTSLNKNINLGARDVTAALTFLNKILPSFGGAANQITVAGQSSGATMIRALLAAPTAASQFKNAILHSDTMYYGFLPKSAYTTLQSSFYDSLTSSCATTSVSCLSSLPLDTILSAQGDLFAQAATLSPAAGSSEPVRPTVDGSFITTSLTGSSFPSTLKPIVITTVTNEAGYVIGPNFPEGYPAAAFEPTVDFTFGDNRTPTIVSAPYYTINSQVDGAVNEDATRETLERLGTDASWRCPNWSFARAYAARGGQVFTGLFELGASYTGNEQIEYCTEDGRVCHQDDIYITFGTTPSPTAAQTKLTNEIQARWGAFIHTSDVNPSPTSYGHWNKSTSTDVHAIKLGLNGGEAAPGACTPNFWGSAVQYDWQLYGVN